MRWSVRYGGVAGVCKEEVVSRVVRRLVGRGDG